MLSVLRLSNRWSTYYNIYIKQTDNKKTEGESVFLTQTHLMPLGSFFTPWKHQKTSGFLMFLGGIESGSGMKWVITNSLEIWLLICSFRCHFWRMIFNRNRMKVYVQNLPFLTHSQLVLTMVPSFHRTMLPWTLCDNVKLPIFSIK